MRHKLFVYGTLIGKENFSKFISEDDEIIEISPAFIEGKLYDGTIPVVVELNKLTKNKMPNLVFGAYTEVESSNPRFFESLDSYEGCSRFRLGKNAENDLYHRKKTKAKIIDAKTLEDLSNIGYNIVKTEKVWVYYINPKSTAALRKVYEKNRIYYWKSFLDLFK